MLSDIFECFLKILLGPVRILIQIWHGPKKTQQNTKKSVSSDAEHWELLEVRVSCLDLHEKYKCVLYHPSTCLIRMEIIPKVGKYPLKETPKGTAGEKKSFFLTLDH